MNLIRNDSFFRCTSCGSTYNVSGWLCDACQKRVDSITITTVINEENHKSQSLLEKVTKKFVL